MEPGRSNPAVSILEGANPIPLLKAVKDPLEIENTKAAYLEDCVALAEFYAELERRLSAGEVIDEYKATEILESCRRSRPRTASTRAAPRARVQK